MGGGLGESSSSAPLPLEGVGPHVDGEPQDGAGLVAEQRVDGQHLQVQGVLLGARDGARQHQHGADVVDLLQREETQGRKRLELLL